MSFVGKTIEYSFRVGDIDTVSPQPENGNYVVDANQPEIFDERFEGQTIVSDLNDHQIILSTQNVQPGRVLGFGLGFSAYKYFDVNGEIDPIESVTLSEPGRKLQPVGTSPFSPKE